MKKTLIIAAVVNLLLCSGMQALSASGWVPGVERISQYTDANGDLFYVQNWGEDGIMPADLVDGFELPPDTYEILEDGTFVPPTILNITNVDGSHIPNPTKWRPTGKTFGIVSSVEEMTDPTAKYILRNETKIIATQYGYREAFGDHGVEVYDELPETVVEGQTIAVGGRKYVGVIRPVLDRYYTNVIKPENVVINHRYVGVSGELQALDCYVAIRDIEIPEHIQEKLKNGETVTVRYKGFSLSTNDKNGYGSGAASVHYYGDGVRLGYAGAANIYKEKDTNSQSDANVWCFSLGYTTASESAAANKFQPTLKNADTLSIGGRVTYLYPIPSNYDLSQLILTFDEVIGETYEDCLIWEYVGDYEEPMPAGFYPEKPVHVAEQEEDMEDVRVKYVELDEGKEYFYADYMNALLRLPDGTVRFYMNGEAVHAGVCEDMDGNYYYINHELKAVANCTYTFSESRGNQLLPGGTYSFNAEGHCISLPEVIDGSNPDDVRNGLVRLPNGDVRYLVDGVPLHKGFVRDSMGNYYYINASTYAMRDCTYTCGKRNDLLQNGTFDFDEDGHIINLPQVIDGGNPVDIQNGLVRYPNGDIRYLVDGEPVHAGLVEDADGNVYYINHTTYAVKDVYYPIWKTNGLMEADGYTFDHDGHIVDIELPAYWRPEVNATIEVVNTLKAEFGPQAFAFVQITDMHVDRVQNLGMSKWVGVLAQNVMNECDIPFAMITGDNNSRAAIEYPDPRSIYMDVEWQDTMLHPIGWNRIARILGNHDGIWGNNEYYYDRSVTMEEKYDLFYSRSMKAYTYYKNIAVTVGTDDSTDHPTYFYLDDADKKVRYINLNAHWAEYTVNDEYSPTYNTFTQGFLYGNQQLKWLANEALNVEEGWTIALFTHVPPVSQYGPVVEGGPSTLQNCKDQFLLMGILNAYAGRTSFTGSFDKYGDWRDSHVSVDYSAGSATHAKGEIAGVFAGHTHVDSINYSSSKYFPVISLREANGTSAGTAREAAFDTVVINPETKRIYMIRTGVGNDRVARYTPEGQKLTFRPGADPMNPEVVLE